MRARKDSPRPPKAALPAEVPELLGNEFGTGEIGFSKADDEELVGIRDLISISRRGQFAGSRYRSRSREYEELIFPV